MTKNKKLILIDGGGVADAHSVYDFILSHGGVVDGWFITHNHDDHVGVLLEILKRDQCEIKIKNLYYNFPNESEIEQKKVEDPYSVREFLDLTKKRNDIIISQDCRVRKGTEIIIDGVKIKVLNDAYFDSDFNFSNNSSVVYKVETPKESVLFFGDLAQRGDGLLKDEYFLNEIKSCAVVQMAHHGQDGVSDEVYKAIDKIKVCLYCAAGWLFDCDNGGGVGSGIWLTLHTRELMRELGVIKTVTSKYGREIIK